MCISVDANMVKSIVTAISVNGPLVCMVCQVLISHTYTVTDSHKSSQHGHSDGQWSVERVVCPTAHENQRINGRGFHQETQSPRSEREDINPH